MRQWWLAVALCVMIPQSFAANWVKLRDSNGAKLMIDKQSIIDVDKKKRAWIKITYTKPQVNEEVAEKTYNLSKLLWFFDCNTQQSATVQVFQYSGDEVIYSAAVDPKIAKFIDPVPETDIDIAMRYVCGIGAALEKPAEKAAEKPVENPTEAVPVEKTEAKKPEPVLEKKSEEAKKPEDAKKAEEIKKPILNKAELMKVLTEEGSKSDKIDIKPIIIPSKTHVASRAAWSYSGTSGPEAWGKLSGEFQACQAGKAQSPINLDNSIHAVLKPMKMFQRFPATAVINTGNMLQLVFAQGNILAIDGVIYSLKQVNFHAPSEHTIKGKSYPLEAQFYHYDPKGGIAAIAVLFEEGEANVGISKIWNHVPLDVGSPKPLKSRMLPSDLMPQTLRYYRYSGSLTTPPCTEGAAWIVMKTPLSASKAQIDFFKKAMHGDNNRPVQERFGRMVLE